jgi:c-di-GMP-related signal transduction protein
MLLLSLMDAIFDRPMSSILASVPVSPDIKAVLLGEDGAFRSAYRLLLACEGADWEVLLDLTTKLKLSEGIVSEIYFKSLEWSRRTLQV